MPSESPFAAVNHVGFVVTDLDAAGRLLEEALGFERVPERRGSLGFPTGDAMWRLFGVNPGATAEFAFFRLGEATVELLQWRGPDRDERPAGLSDLGGRHLALTVTDMAAALDRLRALDGVEVREPNDRGFVYVRTPVGLELQLIPG